MSARVNLPFSPGTDGLIGTTLAVRDVSSRARMPGMVSALDRCGVRSVAVAAS